MRTRKIFGLLIPLLQLLLILKLIELIQGVSINKVSYVASVPYTAAVVGDSTLKSGRNFQARKKKKHYIPFWTTVEPPTTVTFEEIIQVDNNGTEIERHNVSITKRIDESGPKPLCPLQEGDSRQLQNVRQSTLPVLILFAAVGIWVVGLMTFLLLWKVNYYTVTDDYATGIPADMAVRRSYPVSSALNPTVSNQEFRSVVGQNPNYDLFYSVAQLLFEYVSRALVYQ